MNGALKNILFIFIITTGYFLLPACNNNKTEKNKSTTTTKQTYTCPMHPQIITDKPGNCPICGMALVAFDKTNRSDTLTLSEAQQALAHVTTDTVRTGSFSSNKRLNGRLAVNPAQSEFISSRIAGRVEELYVRQTGELVRTGQALYKIYSEQLASLQQEYLIMLAQAAAFPEDKIFKQLVLAAKQKLGLYSQTEAQIEQLKTNKKTNPYVTYYSTASGIVSELFVTQGQYVGEGTAIMSLEAYSTIWVEADLYPAEAHLAKKGSEVKVIIPGFEMEPLTTRIEFIAPALQAGNQLLTARATIPNSGNRFKAGMQAIIELSISENSNVFTLPVEAVIREEFGAHVWIMTDTGKFIPRIVQIGAENYDRVEITNGLKAGEVVVVSGAYLLFSEFRLKKGRNPIDK